MESTSSARKEEKPSRDSDDKEWKEWLESVNSGKRIMVPGGHRYSAKTEEKSSPDSDSDDREWREWLETITGDNNQKDKSLPTQHNPEALKSLSLEYVQSMAGVAFTRLAPKQQVLLLEITRKRFEIWLQKRRLASSSKPPVSPNKGSPTPVGNKRHLSVPPASIPPSPSNIPIAMEIENFLVDKANSGKCSIEKGKVWSSHLPRSPFPCNSCRKKHSAPDLTSSSLRSESGSLGENNGEAPVTLDYSDEEVFDEEQGKSSRANSNTTGGSKAGRKV